MWSDKQQLFNPILNFFKYNKPLFYRLKYYTKMLHILLWRKCNTRQIIQAKEFIHLNLMRYLTWQYACLVMCATQFEIAAHHRGKLHRGKLLHKRNLPISLSLCLLEKTVPESEVAERAKRIYLLRSKEHLETALFTHFCITTLP